MTYGLVVTVGGSQPWMEMEGENLRLEWGFTVISVCVIQLVKEIDRGKKRETKKHEIFFFIELLLEWITRKGKRVVWGSSGFVS